jgi:hypothetical protein
MSIVINGSGTVTGLAVGGLPDGTVDAGYYKFCQMAEACQVLLQRLGGK